MLWNRDRPLRVVEMTTNLSHFKVLHHSDIIDEINQNKVPVLCHIRTELKNKVINYMKWWDAKINLKIETNEDEGNSATNTTINLISKFQTQQDYITYHIRKVAEFRRTSCHFNEHS